MSGYLNFPPIHDEVVQDNNTITVTWKNWVNNLRNILSYVIVSARFNTNYAQKKGIETFLFQLPSMSTADRNALETVPAGAVIFNTDTNLPNFYTGTGWITFTAVAA